MATQGSRRVSLPLIPARDVCGLTDAYVVDGRMTGGMEFPRAIRDADGDLVVGALAVLADSCLGMAMVHASDPPTAIVTAHLHLEMLRRIPAELTGVRCNATLRGASGYYGLTEGSIDDDAGGRLAYATLGGVSLSINRDDLVRPVDGEHRSPPTTHAYRDIDDLLTTEIIVLTESSAHIAFQATPALANLLRNLHGGMCAVMGSRATDLAVRRSAGSVDMRLADLRAVFPRAIAAQDTRVDCRVEIVHRGRRLVVARADLRGPDGRVAVMVDTTYVADPR